MLSETLNGAFLIREQNYSLVLYILSICIQDVMGVVSSSFPNEEGDISLFCFHLPSRSQWRHWILETSQTTNFMPPPLQLL